MIVLLVVYKKNRNVIIKRFLQSIFIAILVTMINIIISQFFNTGFLISLISYSLYLFVALPIFEYMKDKDLLFILQKVLFILIFIVTFIELQFKIQHKIIELVITVIIIVFVFISFLTIKENIKSIKEKFKNPPWRR